MSEPRRLPRVLPRGPNGLPRDVVSASQRHRLLEAIIDSVAAKGYAAATIGDVVAHAGVSRATFYDHFGGKQECFIAAYMTGSHALFEATERAGNDEGDPVRRLRLGTRAYLATLVAEPAWTKVCLIDVVAAGDAAAAAREEVRRWYVELLRDWRRWAASSLPASGEVHPRAYEASVFAVNELVATCVRAGSLSRLADLEEAVLFIELSLCGFPQAAQGVLAGSDTLDMIPAAAHRAAG